MQPAVSQVQRCFHLQHCSRNRASGSPGHLVKAVLIKRQLVPIQQKKVINATTCFSQYNRIASTYKEVYNAADDRELEVKLLFSR